MIEAMYKGLPAVTLPYGDVALGTGEEFCVANYNEMRDKLRLYSTDSAYYLKMSGKAQKRAAYMLDSDNAFTEIINQFTQRIGEFN